VLPRLPSWKKGDLLLREGRGAGKGRKGRVSKGGRGSEGRGRRKEEGRRKETHHINPSLPPAPLFACIKL